MAAKHLSDNELGSQSHDELSQEDTLSQVISVIPNLGIRTDGKGVNLDNRESMMPTVAPQMALLDAGGLVINTILDQLREIQNRMTQNTTILKSEIEATTKELKSDLKTEIINSEKGLNQTLSDLGTKLVCLDTKYEGVQLQMGQVEAQVGLNKSDIKGIKVQLEMLGENIDKLLINGENQKTLKNKQEVLPMMEINIESGTGVIEESRPQKNPFGYTNHTNMESQQSIKGPTLQQPTILKKVGKSKTHMPCFILNQSMPPNFIEEAEEYFFIAGLETDVEKLTMFKYMLTGSVNDWYRGIKADLRSWEELKLAFKDRFHNSYEVERKVRAWENTTISKTEDIEQFVLQGITLLPMLYKQDFFPFLAEKIIRKLPWKMKDHMLSSDRVYKSQREFMNKIRQLVRTKEICEEDDGRRAQGVSRNSFGRNNMPQASNQSSQLGNSQNNVGPFRPNGPFTRQGGNVIRNSNDNPAGDPSNMQYNYGYVRDGIYNARRPDQTYGNSNQPKQKANTNHPPRVQGINFMSTQLPGTMDTSNEGYQQPERSQMYDWSQEGVDPTELPWHGFYNPHGYKYPLISGDGKAPNTMAFTGMMHPSMNTTPKQTTPAHQATGSGNEV